MLKILLYGLAAAMETGVGVWVFAQMFPRRDTMGKRQIVSAWIVYSLIMMSVYTFPRFYFKVNKIKWYLPTLLAVYCITICIYLLHRRRKAQSKIENIVMWGLFIGMADFFGWQYWTACESYLLTLMGNLLPVFFLYAYYKCRLVQAYLWEFLYVTNISLIKMIYVTYVGTFTNRRFENFFLIPRVHAYSEVIFFMVAYCIIFVVFCTVHVDKIFKRIFDRYRKALFALAICEWAILLVLMNFGMGEISRRNLTYTLVVVIGILVGLCILLMKSSMSVVNSEKNLLDVRNEAVEREYRELSDAYAKYRCLVHDEKHMILYLQECLEHKEVEAAKRFLKNYQDNMVNSVNDSWTGISMLDFMLNIKKKKMDELMVEFCLDCKIDEIPMEDADFIVVLGNLLDNAIEASARCDRGKRRVELSILNINEMFIMKLRNTSASRPRQKNGRFVSNKKDRNRHGFGIESVKRIVEKYEGFLEFDYDDNVFSVAIMINEGKFTQNVFNDAVGCGFP